MKSYLMLLLLVLFTTTQAAESIPELTIEPIETDVYLHVSYQHVNGFGLVDANGLVVIDGRKAFIIDTPWSTSDTEKLVQWIKAQGYEPAGSVSTHSHEDRTAGIAWLNAHSIPTFTSKQTSDILKKNAKALPIHTFDQDEFQLADNHIQTYYPGAGHAVDNIVVWLPRSKILFGGCFVKSLSSKNLGYTGEAIIEQWPASIVKVLSKFADAKTVIPGHGEIGDLQLLTHTKALAETAVSALKR